MTHESDEPTPGGRHPADWLRLQELEPEAANVLQESVAAASAVTYLLGREHPEGIPDHLYLMLTGFGAYTLRHHELVGVRQHDLDTILEGIEAEPVWVLLGLVVLAPQRSDLQAERDFWRKELVTAYRNQVWIRDPNEGYWQGFIKPVARGLAGTSPFKHDANQRRSLLDFTSSLQNRANGRLRSGLGLGKFLDNTDRPASQQITEHYLKYCYKAR